MLARENQSKARRVSSIAQEPRNHLLAAGKLVDDYEIEPGQLKLGVEIGKGAFGRVHLATAENLAGRPGPTLVAVKQMKS